MSFFVWLVRGLVCWCHVCVVCCVCVCLFSAWIAAHVILVCYYLLDDLHSVKAWDISRQSRAWQNEILAHGEMGPNPDTVPDVILRMKNLASNPGSGAMAFENCIEVFISDVLNWDIRKRKHRSKKPGGLFGVTRAWAYCVETQGRGISLFVFHICTYIFFCSRVVVLFI